MPDGLRRYYGKGHLHFITFSCYWRLPLLKSAKARDLFVGELKKLRKEAGFDLAGYVVMPEHVHGLSTQGLQVQTLKPAMSEPKQETPSTVLQKLKLRVARKLRKRKRRAHPAQMSLVFGELREEWPSFWQARFHDFNVFTERKRIEKLNYMHENPVKRGLVSHPKDWRWSSWGVYYGRGARSD